MSSHSVQLGTIHLSLVGSQDFPNADGRWSSLDAGLLQSVIWEAQFGETVGALLGIMGDLPLSCSADWQRQNHQIVVRLSLLPSDAPGSTWKRHKRNERSRDLKRLFRNLQEGWDGGGAWVMGLTVGCGLFAKGEALTHDEGGR